MLRPAAGDKQMLTASLYEGGMSGWTFAWSDQEEVERTERAGWRPIGLRAAATIGIVFSLWFFLFAVGALPTLGWAEGSERHDRNAVYLTEETSFGLPGMYLLKGQRLWWDYDVTVEGRGGVRLWLVKSVPSREFHVRTLQIDQSGRGRFEAVVPESGLYGFDHELIPHGAFLSGTTPGRTSYRLRWGVS